MLISVSILTLVFVTEEVRKLERDFLDSNVDSKNEAFF